MDISDVITQTPASTTIDVDLSPASPSSPVLGDASGTGSSIPWGTIIRYALIVLVLAFLGFNIFNALGGATDTATGFLGPLLERIGWGTGETIKQVTNVSAEGAKLAVDVAAGTVDDAATLLEKSVGVKGVQFNRVDDRSTSTDAALASAVKSQESNEPDPDEAGSSTQQSRSLPKSGYCYIGEDRGFRSCVRVNQGDMCMSGDIFPSKDICVNPSLRE